MKIKTKDLKDIREKLESKQDYLCALCGKPLLETNHLDHNHRSGAIRGALHSGCNLHLGPIENRQAMNKIEDLVQWLRKAADYLELHSTDQTGLRHPTHFTPEERKERNKKRAARRKAK
jgi:hypothetical protein